MYLLYYRVFLFPNTYSFYLRKRDRTGGDCYNLRAVHW